MDKAKIVKYLIVVSVVIIFFWVIYPRYIRKLVCRENYTDIRKSVDPITMTNVYPLPGNPNDIITGPDLIDPVFDPISGIALDEPNNPFLDRAAPATLVPLSDSDNKMNFNSYLLQKPICSKTCCSSQWPVPFKLDDDDKIDKKDYTPVAYSCNTLDQDTGCLCIKKDYVDFIGTRGLNI